MHSQRDTIGHEDTRIAAEILRNAEIDDDARHVEDYSGRFRHGRASPAAIVTSAGALQAGFALAIAALSRMPEDGDPAEHLENHLSSVPACQDAMGLDTSYCT